MIPKTILNYEPSHIDSCFNMFDISVYNLCLLISFQHFVSGLTGVALAAMLLTFLAGGLCLHLNFRYCFSSYKSI